MWCIFNEAPVMEGLESRLIWRAANGGSGDEAVGPLLIKGLLEVGWHHDWARVTCTAVQHRGSDGKKQDVWAGLRLHIIQIQKGNNSDKKTWIKHWKNWMATLVSVRETKQPDQILIRFWCGGKKTTTLPIQLYNWTFSHAICPNKDGTEKDTISHKPTIRF